MANQYDFGHNDIGGSTFVPAPTFTPDIPNITYYPDRVTPGSVINAYDQFAEGHNAAQNQLEQQFIDDYNRSTRQTDALVKDFYASPPDSYNPSDLRSASDQFFDWITDIVRRNNELSLLAQLYYSSLSESERVILIEKQYFDRDIEIEKQPNALDSALGVWFGYLILRGKAFSTPKYGYLFGNLAYKNATQTLASAKILKFPGTKITVGQPVYARTTVRTAPALLSLLALQQFHPNDLTVNGMGLVEFSTKQLERVDVTWSPYREKHQTINTTEAKITTTATAGKIEFNYVPHTRIKQANAATPFKLQPNLKPYPSVIPPPARFFVAVPEPVTPLPDLYSFPTGKITVEFTNGLNVKVKIQQQTATKRTRSEENTNRQDTKTRSQTSYLAALHLMTKTWGRVSEKLDLFNAIADNIQVNVGGFWYTYGSLSYTQKRNPTILQKMRDGQYTIDFAGIAHSVLVQEMTDNMVYQLSNQEKKLLRDSTFWANTYGNPSTWVTRNR